MDSPGKENGEYIQLYAYNGPEFKVTRFDVILTMKSRNLNISISNSIKHIYHFAQYCIIIQE